MRTNTLRAGIVAGIATATLGGLLASTPSSATSVERAGTAGASTTEQQKGLVLECSGDGVLATVYENSRYGNSATVILGDPDEGHFGYVEQSAPFVVDEVLSLVVDVEGVTATVAGTVAPDGRPTKLVEPLQDNGEQIVTRGTNTPLATDLVVTLDGESVALECAPAFAFDLEVRRVSLYGN